ncbi:MAG: hypothetical protein ACRDZ5_11330 [Acidimicrobiales bacterium]
MELVAAEDGVVVVGALIDGPVVDEAPLAGPVVEPVVDEPEVGVVLAGAKVVVGAL